MGRGDRRRGRDARRDTQALSAVAFSPDGKRVLTGSWDKTARLWDAATGARSRRSTGHTDRVTAVAFSPDGKRVLTGSYDKTARLWDAATGARSRRSTGHTDLVAAVAFSPDGKRVLTGSSTDGAAVGRGDRRPVATLEGTRTVVSAVAFSPDGKRVLTGSSDKTARLWDAATGKPVATLEGHTGRVIGGRLLARRQARPHRLLGQHGAAVGRGDRQPVATLEGHTGLSGRSPSRPTASGSSPAPGTTRHGCGTRRPAPRSRRSRATQRHVYAVAFSPDGKRVLTGSYDKTARLWDAATGEAVATLEGHTGAVDAVAFSPDGKRVLTGSDDKTARLWHVFSSAQAVVDEVKASVASLPDAGGAQAVHLRRWAPRWCHTRNLWPHLDHGPPEA